MTIMYGKLYLKFKLLLEIIEKLNSSKFASTLEAVVKKNSMDILSLVSLKYGNMYNKIVIFESKYFLTYPPVQILHIHILILFF